MKTLFAIFIIILVFVALPQANAMGSKRPVILVFDTNKGEGADKDFAASTTKALKNYLRDSQRVDIILFDRQSPTVLRAIMDKRLTSDKVASYSSQPERVEVAKILAFDYACGSEISIKSALVEVKLWLAKVDGGKNDKWEATGIANSTGTGPNDLENAMQCAASAAVVDIARRAFTELPLVNEKQPAGGSSETTAIGADQVASPSLPTATDYKTQADESLNAGNLALAIQQYSLAVSADPNNGSLRIKLSDAYSRKGLYDRAIEELDRALTMGADKAQVDAAKQQIEQLRNGQQPQLPAQKESKPESNPNNVKSVAMSATSGKSGAAKMAEGDKLWGQGQPDEAADAYKEAIKIDPSDWRAYERLAIVDASMSMFGESRGVIELLNKVQPNPPSDIVKNRYLTFRKAFDNHFASLLKQYDSDSADFAKRVINRESYYSTIKGLSIRMESMAKFLDALTVPDGNTTSNLHRSLACGLMAQAASNQLDYLETNSETSKSNAATFAEQAKKEIETAAKMDAGNASSK